MNKNTVLYLCDGAVEACPKTSCYKRGHECCHTTDVTHALNLEPRNLIPEEKADKGFFLFQSPSLGYCLLDDEPDTGVWQSQIGHDRVRQ